MWIRQCCIGAVVLFLGMTSRGMAGTSLGLSDDIVGEHPTPNAFPLVESGRATALYVDPSDFEGVQRAASDLREDIGRVTTLRPELRTTESSATRDVVWIGTLGKSPTIDGLVKSGTLHVESIAGKWESFVIAVVAHPAPGVDHALIVAGSDKRGTIYGIYELSEQMGVSPWYWWADVPAKHHAQLYVRPGTFTQGPPAVKYRGIFINDEEPCLGPWARAKFGGVNSKMYAHMFELILRLRGNFLWPAMWGKAFNEDDPADARVADEYGVVMGTSHHEPMLRAQAEWGRHRKQYGNGEWNYATNAAGLRQFWIDGVERNKAYESIYTLGMRGDGDVAMPDAGGLEANKTLLETIIGDQRKILAAHVNPDVTHLPQLWALFTEVQQYYDAGLNVPDDVTLLFTDDNVGNLRRVPTTQERSRAGGSGIYFHMDMNGGPYSYKWINTNPLPKIAEQMNLAYEYGARQIWIANVGDLKPLEIPLEFFLRMAWNPPAMQGHIADYQRRWAEREFGPEHASEIADLAARYAKYNAWRKPEVVRPDTYSLIHFQEAERVSQAWNELADRASTLNAALPPEERDAFYELILYPVLAGRNFNNLYIAAGRNALYAKQGRASTNTQAQLVRTLFQTDQELSDYYNDQLLNGKWKHMMDQTHIGYTSWQSPKTNLMPTVVDLPLSDSNAFGVAVDGAPESWPGPGKPSLPEFDSFHPQRSFIDIFAKGTAPPSFVVQADRPWIHVEQAPLDGAKGDQRLWVSIDWAAAPVGRSEGSVQVIGDSQNVTVRVVAVKASDDQEKAARGCFASLTGVLAFSAADAQFVSSGNIRWDRLDDYGRGKSAVTIVPVTAATIAPGAPAPTLNYPLYLPDPGTYDIDVITGPTLDVIPTRRLGLSVSVDNQPPEIVEVFTPKTSKSEDFLGQAYGMNTRNNARTMHFTQTFAQGGRHLLSIGMVDPTLVLQKVIVHDKPLPPSYFGPPEEAAFGNKPQD
ncbi:MAG: glycosyl hydrolase 115 family protein [Tepidisphaeraceae bacterium]